ncbi:hypothetical protein Pmani_024498 [Petrolisthes manimaculis]|uniref:Nucleolar complex protein 2 homolog n=1 Tax=Petrolisthes manimaculis TaxID=1843537 RepID=A0AAE1P7N4_9EUCA|nr:hypothetical protein Pmani_024498 [Petrolisthes manimaculis]
MKAKSQMKKMKKDNSKQGNKSSNKRFAETSIDDMISMVEDDDEMSEEAPKATKQKRKLRKKKLEQGERIEDEEEEEDDDFGEENYLAGKGRLSQEEYLKHLKQTDPEFYATMMESRDILDMHSSGSENEMEGSEKEDDEGDDEEYDPERGGAVLELPDKLEADSDESGAEEEESLEKRGHNVVTYAMVTEWEKQLNGPEALNAFVEVNQAFSAAITSLGEKKKQETVASKYKVEGPQIFNAIIRMCLKNIPTAISRILSVKTNNENPSKCKKWSKYRNFIKAYLRNIVMLTECVAEPTALEAILSRGVMHLLPYFAANNMPSQMLFKRLTTLWATSEKRVQVLAFICIFRLCRALKGSFLEWGLKRLYITYVHNSRFTSPSTWGLIDFMRVSLVELYALNEAFAYKHAFVYIRQMAIHLRNAITIKKKDQVQLVYNWQYIHCLHLWADLLGKTHPSPALQPIIYPLTQVAIGTMKLQPTATFTPLVFHVCGILTSLSRYTRTFIPVLPFLLEVLNKTAAVKTQKKFARGHLDWMCMLRVSRGEMAESAFKDGLVEQVYNGLIDYLSVESSSISFPELVVPAVLQLKVFIKNQKNSPEHTIKMKQLLDKIKENSAFIESKRRDVSFGIANSKAVEDWEISIKQQGSPLEKHYQLWKTAWEKQHMKRLSNRVLIDDVQLPTIKKKELLDKQKARDKEDIKDLFLSDNDDNDDSDDETRFLMRAERPLKPKDTEEEDEDEDEEDDDEEEDESEDEENEVNGGEKKDEDLKAEDFNIADIEDDGAADVVTEINFSDIEADDEVDDFGDQSD